MTRRPSETLDRTIMSPANTAWIRYFSVTLPSEKSYIHSMHSTNNHNFLCFFGAFPHSLYLCRHMRPVTCQRLSNTRVSAVQNRMALTCIGPTHPNTLSQRSSRPFAMAFRSPFYSSWLSFISCFRRSGECSLQFVCVFLCVEVSAIQSGLTAFLRQRFGGKHNNDHHMLPRCRPSGEFDAHFHRIQESLQFPGAR